MPLLSAQHIRKFYRRTHVLSDVNFEIEPSTLVGIVGENGSGKSTLLKILSGDIPASAGTVKAEGAVGYCPQQPIVNDALSPREHFRYFQAAYHLPDTSRAEQLMEQLNYQKFYTRPAGQLSGGTKQKLNLTLALMHSPKILLLDEPYQGFDWDTYLHFWDIVKDLKGQGCAIIVISHLLFERKSFDQILHLQDGVLIKETA